MYLPSFVNAQEELKSKGVDLTSCVATNESYIMEAWGRTSGGADAGIVFLSDGKDAELHIHVHETRALGLSMGKGGMIQAIIHECRWQDGSCGERCFSADEHAGAKCVEL